MTLFDVRDHVVQQPISGRPVSTFGDAFSVVIHPAFRLGFLDARDGRPFAHDGIVARIETETPAGALARLAWHGGWPIELAQYRYEEGRLVWWMWRPRVKAWGHPDFPPVAIRRLCEVLAAERAA